MSITPTTRHRFDGTMEAATHVAPIAPILFMVGYAWDRSRAAARDDGGFSTSIEQVFWAAIAVSLVAAVGLVIYNAVEGRGDNIGDDITNRELP